MRGGKPIVGRPPRAAAPSARTERRDRLREQSTAGGQGFGLPGASRRRSATRCARDECSCARVREAAEDKSADRPRCHSRPERPHRAARSIARAVDGGRSGLWSCPALRDGEARRVVHAMDAHAPESARPPRQERGPSAVPLAPRAPAPSGAIDCASSRRRAVRALVLPALRGGGARRVVPATNVPAPESARPPTRERGPSAVPLAPRAAAPSGAIDCASSRRRAVRALVLPGASRRRSATRCARDECSCARVREAAQTRARTVRGA